MQLWLIDDSQPTNNESERDYANGAVVTNDEKMVEFMRSRGHNVVEIDLTQGHFALACSPEGIELNEYDYVEVPGAEGTA